MQSLLVVDDEPDFITGFRRALAREDLDLIPATSGEEALRLAAERRPDVIFMDLRMPGMDGLQTLKKLREIDPRLIIILMTAHTTTGTVIEAMKSGAYDFIAKPFTGPRLRQLVGEALKVANDMRNVVSFAPAPTDDSAFESIVGRSDAMQRVYKAIGQVADSNATVLITGESGTGKELVARAIYHHSGRAEKPFIAVNCAAIPENLLESELFGHEKGSFSGAVSRKPGKFEVARSGTIFLDEIGDMTFATQTKVLRVLQDGTFQRVGGVETLQADVRVIAATNRDLPRMIRDGQFRADLYYRLNVVHIELPPLRDRAEDIPALIDYFLRRIRRETRRSTPMFSTQAVQMMQVYPWPGNVRELENVVRNLVLTAKADTILPSDLRLKGDLAEAVGESLRRHTPLLPTSADMAARLPAIPNVQPQAPPPAREVEEPQAEEPEDEAPVLVDDALFADIDRATKGLFHQLLEARSREPRLSTFDVMERALIVHALNESRGNQVRAARLLGITRSTLRKRIARYGLRLDTQVRSHQLQQG